jgi:thiol-disulfide isomerase/thioredoxin
MNPACRPGSASLGERSTLVYFWASWCGPCKLLFEKLRGGIIRVDGRVELAAAPDSRLIAIGVDRTCDEFKAAVAAEDPPGAEFWAGGWYGKLPQALGVGRRGIPTAALLDSKGRLVRIATGVDSIMAMVTPDPTEPPDTLKPVFQQAADEFHVPVEVLMAVAYVSSHWEHHGGETSLYGDCGIMGLKDTRDKRATLGIAAGLIGLPPDSLRSLKGNVRGGAALLAHEFVAVHGRANLAKNMRVVDNWRDVLPRFTRYGAEGADEVFFRRFKTYLAARGFGSR